MIPSQQPTKVSTKNNQIMKNYKSNPKPSGLHFGRMRKLVKARNSIRPKNGSQHTPNPPAPTEHNTRPEYVVEDLANHEVQILEYNYYMDSYS